jgi:hypothetical protein
MAPRQRTPPAAPCAGCIRAFWPATARPAPAERAREVAPEGPSAGPAPLRFGDTSPACAGEVACGTRRTELAKTVGCSALCSSAKVPSALRLILFLFQRTEHPREQLGGGGQRQRTGGSSRGNDSTKPSRAGSARAERVGAGRLRALAAAVSPARAAGSGRATARRLARQRVKELRNAMPDLRGASAGDGRQPGLQCGCRRNPAVTRAALPIRDEAPPCTP